MKHSKFSIFELSLIVLAILLCCACDVIDSPYTKSGGEGPIPIDTVKPKILLEEFTGHLCVNCPKGAATARQLEELYPNYFFAVSLHSGHFAKPEISGEKYKYDFRTSVGEELNEVFEADAIGEPCGLINRKSFNGSLILSPELWGAAVSSIFENSPNAEVKIELDANYNSSTNTIKTNITLDYLSSQSTTNKVCVWILEDGIINWQRNYQAPIDISDYVHNNVLRYSYNGTWGDGIGASNIEVGYKYSKEYTHILPANCDWNALNLKVVVFVYDDENGIKQVEVIRVANN